MSSYLSKQIDAKSVVGLKCWVRYPYEATRTGTIKELYRDGRSEHVKVRLDGDEYNNYFMPQVVFLSEPIEVKIRDIYGECTVWQESACKFR